MGDKEKVKIESCYLQELEKDKFYRLKINTNIKRPHYSYVLKDSEIEFNFYADDDGYYHGWDKIVIPLSGHKYFFAYLESRYGLEGILCDSDSIYKGKYILELEKL